VLGLPGAETGTGKAMSIMSGGVKIRVMAKVARCEGVPSADTGFRVRDPVPKRISKSGLMFRVLFREPVPFRIPWSESKSGPSPSCNIYHYLL